MFNRGSCYVLAAWAEAYFPAVDVYQMDISLFIGNAMVPSDLLNR